METLNGFKSTNKNPFSYNHTYLSNSKFDILTKNNNIVPYFVVGKSKILIAYYLNTTETFLPLWLYIPKVPTIDYTEFTNRDTDVVTAPKGHDR